MEDDLSANYKQTRQFASDQRNHRKVFGAAPLHLAKVSTFREPFGKKLGNTHFPSQPVVTNLVIC